MNFKIPISGIVKRQEIGQRYLLFFWLKILHTNNLKLYIKYFRNNLDSLSIIPSFLKQEFEVLGISFNKPLSRILLCLESFCIHFSLFI